MSDKTIAPESEPERTEYFGPEELLTAREALDAIIGELGDTLQGRLMSAIDDIDYVMSTFMATPKEIAEMESEENDLDAAH